MTYKDKNGTILAIGDKIKNSQGKIRRLENIRGVAMAVERDHDNKIISTITISKMDLSQMEKII